LTQIFTSLVSEYCDNYIVIIISNIDVFFTYLISFHLVSYSRIIPGLARLPKVNVAIYRPAHYTSQTVLKRCRVCYIIIIVIANIVLVLLLMLYFGKCCYYPSTCRFVYHVIVLLRMCDVLSSVHFAVFVFKNALSIHHWQIQKALRSPTSCSWW